MSSKGLTEEVDVVYITSDGKKFLTQAEADSHSRTLADENITTHVKDALLREHAGQRLMRIISMVDYVKQCKALEKDPTYKAYKDTIRGKGADQKAFDFAKRNVFSNRGVQLPGLRQEIYLLSGDIVSARLVKVYPLTKLFMTDDDRLVVTCPTNFEFEEVDVYDIFGTMERESSASQKRY